MEGVAAWRVLLAFPLLAGLALAQEAVERDVRLAGTIQLDGRPWSGGRARLQPLQRDADLAEGPPIDVLADERGEFAVRVPRLACRLHAGPGWPEGAATRTEPERTPARPGEPRVWVTWAHGLHGTIGAAARRRPAPARRAGGARPALAGCAGRAARGGVE